MTNDAAMRGLLAATRTIAMVGVSMNELRPSWFVARYLTLKGYAVIPINPGHAGKSLLGETVLASLAEIPPDRKVDMVDIFRRSEQAGAVVDEAIALLGPQGLGSVWMQIGVIDDAAAARARAAGLIAVMNRCPKMEYQRLHGELSWGGINSGVISSRLR
ncbi:MAG: CoA-binding protein [Pseudomonadota bacterium]